MIRADFMELVKGKSLQDTPCAVSIGVFDGMHIGHRAIIRRLVSLSREKGWRSMAVTFDRNPKYRVKPLWTQRLETEMFAQMGVDALAVIDFSPDFAKLSAEEFLNLLLALCKVKAMVVGEDFLCGNPASCAGPEQLGVYLNRHGSDAPVVVPPLVRMDGGEAVSSSVVRKQLLAGRMDVVQYLLGRPYGLDMAHVPFHIQSDSLCFPVASVPQMLPPQGLYEGAWKGKDGKERPVEVRLTSADLLLSPRAGSDPDDGILLLTERKGT